jgi:hypothetical protein
VLRKDLFLNSSCATATITPSILSFTSKISKAFTPNPYSSSLLSKCS